MSIYEELGKVVTEQQLIKTEIAKINNKIDEALSKHKMPAIKFYVYQAEAEKKLGMPELVAKKKELQSKKIKLLNQCKKEFKYNQIEAIEL